MGGWVEYIGKERYQSVYYRIDIDSVACCREYRSTTLLLYYKVFLEKKGSMLCSHEETKYLVDTLEPEK